MHPSEGGPGSISKDFASAMMFFAWGAICSKFLKALVRARLTASLFVFTTNPSFTFSTHASIVTRRPLDRPGTSTAHRRHAPEGLSDG
jgi:hypothetical protein